MAKDSILEWSCQAQKQNLNSIHCDTNISKYKFWGILPYLKFNKKKTCFYITAYFAYKISSDSLKNYFMVSKKAKKEFDSLIEMGEVETTTYYGKTIIVDDREPNYSLSTYTYSSFLVKITKNNKIKFTGYSVGAGGDFTIDEKLFTEQELIEHFEMRTNYIEKIGDKYCLIDYYKKLDEKEYLE
jgi:hypothetical protein